MKQLLEVREFDTIIGNEDYADDFPCLPETVFQDFKEFIHAYTSDENNTDALQFLKIGYKRNIGDTISVNNYVGLIQMQNGWQVQVLPKIDFVSTDDNAADKTKKVFLWMLRSMKDFSGKAFNDADLKISHMNLFEIFINMYLQEVRGLLRRGLKSAYIRQEDNLNVYKGKILVNEHIKNNFVHQDKFYVSYDEYNLNRSENRLIKSTLLKLQKISGSAENQKEIRQQLCFFELITPSVNYVKDFSCIVIDRSTCDYEILMRWSKVFLMILSFDLLIRVS